MSSGASSMLALHGAEHLGKGFKLVAGPHDSGDRYPTTERYTT